MTTESTDPEKDASAREMVIQRRFVVMPERLFRAWTVPPELSKWWGPRGFPPALCEIDLRERGSYRIEMQGPDGTRYPIRGIFLEISNPDRLVMTMNCAEHPKAWHDAIAPNRPPEVTNPVGIIFCTITFEATADGTELTIRQRMEKAYIRDAMLKLGMIEGWNQSLDKLAELVIER